MILLIYAKEVFQLLQNRYLIMIRSVELLCYTLKTKVLRKPNNTDIVDSPRLA